MNRKMVILPVLALLMIIAFAPALTVAAEKVPVTATLSNFKAVPGPDSTYWVVADSVVQCRNWVTSGVMSLHIDSSPAADYVMEINTVVSGTVNHGKDIPFPGPWPEAKGIWTHEVICTYKVDGAVQGTFEGIWNLKSVGWYATQAGYSNGHSEGHTVLHGTGIFEGMTLYLETIGPSTTPSAAWTGYALLH